MPTPRAYGELYQKYEELRWHAFALVNAMTAEEEEAHGRLHDAVWERVADVDGPYPWIEDQKD